MLCGGTKCTGAKRTDQNSGSEETEVNDQQTERVTTWQKTDPVHRTCLQYKIINKKLSWP